MKIAVTPVKVTRAELTALVVRIEGLLPDSDYRMIKAVFETLMHMMWLLEAKRMTIHRLCRWLFGASSEKTRHVLKATTIGNAVRAAAVGSAVKDGEGAAAARTVKRTVPGHGRHSVKDYPGAERISIAHPQLSAGAACPECEQGKVYPVAPTVVVRVTGQAPLHACIYELGKLRCHLCGKLFAAPTPAQMGTTKYDAKAAAMIASLRYGSGMPFYRNERLQGNLGVPLAASTQWDIVAPAARAVEPIHAAFIEHAAQGEIIHNDDTPAKVLALMAATKEAALLVAPANKDKPRTGIFTTGIVALNGPHKIALFFTGRQHAGENLADVLAHRDAQLPAPIQMCDALSRNLPKNLQVIIAHCLSHARRLVVDVVPRFPDACARILTLLGEVYQHDRHAKEHALSNDARLAYHQAHSAGPMQELHRWCTEQFEQRMVEPNSGLGKAIKYLCKHWVPLTLFLRTSGAPLDNNVCEQALKRAILCRKNSLFYRTQAGADVGDIFMSLIHTCHLNGVNAFAYLTALLEHRADWTGNENAWMPWNYITALAALNTT
ncbi:MAG: IS66 family transposase [Steroidobacteraceae bacterium]